jgi:Uma2 family endonuclease
MPVETSFVSDETFSQEEFWRWLQRRPASDVHHYELIGGRIVMSPPAGMRHGGLEARLVQLFANHVRPRGLGAVFGSSTGYDLPTGDTLEPDVSFVATAAMRTVARPLPERFARVVPSLVVEILSPSSARRDRKDKRAIYARSGVAEYWIVDARRREVLVHDLASGELVLRETYASGRIVSRILPELEIDVDEVFADLA